MGLEKTHRNDAFVIVGGSKNAEKNNRMVFW